MTPLLQLLLVGGMALALFTVPVGLPGVWVMVFLAIAGPLAGWMGWTTWAVLVAAAGLAELGEFIALKRMGDRYGGSRGAFWGAIGGGFLGVLVGAPVPLVGSLVAALAGTFLGAAAVTWWGTRSARSAGSVGWGMVVGRVVAVGLKVGAGVVILALTGAALLVG